MPSYKIRHITRYSYSSTVIDCTNQIMLYPVIDGLLEVRNHVIKISHNPAVETFIDYFGNHIGVFSVVKPHTELLIESIADVITKPIIFPSDDTNATEQWNFLGSLRNHSAYMDFLRPEMFISYAEVKNILSNVISEEITPLQNAKL